MKRMIIPAVFGIGLAFLHIATVQTTKGAIVFGILAFVLMMFSNFAAGELRIMEENQKMASMLS